MVVTVHYIGFHPTMILDGFEKLRVSKPIEKVYILYDKKNDRYGAVSKYNAQRLAQVISFFKPILVGVNPLSYDSLFTKLYSILDLEVRVNKRDVYIDCTDMPQEAMSAVITLSIIFGSASPDSTPMPTPTVYVYTMSTESRGEFIPPPDSPAFYEWIEEKDSKRGVDMELIPLPSAKLELIEEDVDESKERKVLEVLYKKKGHADSLKTLIEWCEGVNAADKPRVKNEYSRLVTRLSRKGLVYKSYGGKVRKIGLTEFGRIFISAILNSEKFKERVRDAEKQRSLKPLVGTVLEL
ncbi:MAG: hypothetical protein DRZ80_02790 [Thermoprotei archaeon]|nr:MAG: hypothetical protein DRZ80_02790 [Thermoprotei archaeon]